MLGDLHVRVLRSWTSNDDRIDDTSFSAAGFLLPRHAAAPALELVPALPLAARTRAMERRRFCRHRLALGGRTLAHPHLYRLATEGPLPRELLPEGLEAWAAEPVVRLAGTQAKARAVWAFAHGMTILELDGRFPPGADLDAAWRSGVAALA